MNKNLLIDELTNILALALRHKIGTIVRPNEIYTDKYAKDSEIFFREAEKIKDQHNWNYQDKLNIQQELKRKLRKELESKDFLPDEKYDYVDSEIDKALRALGLEG
ncbi:MAG: hypothetical protein WC781_01475 [Candidatus Pacearchaeota archaeon]|jgi:hypothetical protein